MNYTTLPFPQDRNRHLPSVHEQGIAIFIDCHPGYWLEADNGLRFQIDPSPITNDFPLYPVHGPHRFPDPSHNVCLSLFFSSVLLASKADVPWDMGYDTY